MHTYPPESERLAKDLSDLLVLVRALPEDAKEATLTSALVESCQYLRRVESYLSDHASVVGTMVEAVEVYAFSIRTDKWDAFVDAELALLRAAGFTGPVLLLLQERLQAQCTTEPIDRADLERAARAVADFAGIVCELASAAQEKQINIDQKRRALVFVALGLVDVAAIVGDTMGMAATVGSPLGLLTFADSLTRIASVATGARSLFKMVTEAPRQEERARLLEWIRSPSFRFKLKP